MNRLQKNIQALTGCIDQASCKDCNYNDDEDCINTMLSEARSLLEEADRRLNYITKMLTEWQMVDLKSSLLREVILWENFKNKV